MDNGNKSDAFVPEGTASEIKMNHALTLRLEYELVIEDVSDLEVELEKAGFGAEDSKHQVEQLMRLVPLYAADENLPEPGNEEDEWMAFWLCEEKTENKYKYWTADRYRLEDDNLTVLVGPIRFQGQFKNLEMS